VENTPIGVKKPLGEEDKNILLKQKLNGTVLNVDIMNPDNKYSGNKTGADFIKTQDKDMDPDEHFYTGAETKLKIAENRVLIYEGLKKMSSDDVEKKSEDLFNFVEETSKDANLVL